MTFDRGSSLFAGMGLRGILGTVSLVALTAVGGISMQTSSALAGNECLLDTNNNGVADAADTDGGANSGADPRALACGTNAVAVGPSVAVGGNANAAGNQSVSVGVNSDALGASSTAVGSDAQAAGANSSAFGESSNASGVNSTSIGADSDALGANSSAVGQGAQAAGVGNCGKCDEGDQKEGEDFVHVKSL